MTRDELHSLASAVYGARWQSRLSRDMSVALRTVQRWARDGIDRTATAEGARRFLEERRVARVAAPPAGTTDAENRDDDCADALEPAVLATIAAAADVGWSDAEILAAILTIIVHEMRQRAGDHAATATLTEAIQTING